MRLPAPHLLSKPVRHTRKSKATVIKKKKTKEILLGLFFLGGQARCENPYLPLGWQVEGSGKAELPPLPPGCTSRLFPHPPPPPRPAPPPVCSQASPAVWGQGRGKGAATCSRRTPPPCPRTACRPRYCRRRCTGC